MPIKDAIRTCQCKYCGQKFAMFVNHSGELLYFPEKTVWPAQGYFELLSHLKKQHRELYNLYLFLTINERKKQVKECYSIA